MTKPEVSNFSENEDNVVDFNQEEWDARSAKVNEEKKEIKKGKQEKGQTVNIENYKKRNPDGVGETELPKTS